jgi:plastocyanin
MKRLLLAAAAVSLWLAASAWGYQGASSPRGIRRADATTLRLKAIDGIKYDKKTLVAPKGVVKIVMKSASPLKHDVALKGNGVSARGKIVGLGGTSTVTATLKAGKYTFYCTVPGHAAAGMKGTLTIK